MSDEGVIVAAIAATTIALAGGAIVFTTVNVADKSVVQDCTVSNKESVISNGANEYRVYTDNCGVLAVKDSIFATRWDSADVYNRIETGETYDFHVQGGRYPMLSMFPNIISMEVSR